MPPRPSCLLLAGFLTAHPLAAPLGASEGYRRSDQREPEQSFSPEHLDRALERQEEFIQYQNRSAGAFAEGDAAQDSAADRFLLQQNMAEEIEKRRTRTARALSAMGLRYKVYPDGRKVWNKDGRVHRIEKEPVRSGGKTIHRDTLEMTYDDKGNLVAYRTEEYDDKRARGYAIWAAEYEESGGVRRRTRQTERRWDGLGNESRVTRDAMRWDAAGRLASYEETTVDSFGKRRRRSVYETRYDDEGRVAFVREAQTDEKGVRRAKIWRDAVYEDDADGNSRLAGYREESWDSFGRRSSIDWSGARYDAAGNLAGWEERRRDGAGETTVRRWDGARYDDAGRLVEFRERIERPGGVSSVRRWFGAQYDDNDRLTAYREKTEEDGVVRVRAWSGAVYNARNELLSYDESSDGPEGTERRSWRAEAYDRGEVASFREEVVDPAGRKTFREWTGMYGADGRLDRFREITQDSAGHRTERERLRTEYDDRGRVVSYGERRTDSFGEAVEVRWRAEAFDDDDRPVAFAERETSAARILERRTEGIEYDRRGRTEAYVESARSDDGRSGRRNWRALEWDALGRVISFKEENVDPLGRTTERIRRNAAYDSFGRLRFYAERTRGGEGEATDVVWTAREFDDFGRVTAHEQTVRDARAETRIVWRGRFDPRGLLLQSSEARVRGEESSEAVMESAAYDERGRLVRSVETTSSAGRSRRTERRVFGYGAAGEPAAFQEETTIRADGQEWTIRKVREGADFRAGRLGSYRETTVTAAPDGARVEDVLEVDRTEAGRAENRSRRAYSEAGLQTDTTQSVVIFEELFDLQGRLVQCRESFRRGPSSGAEVFRRNAYAADGQLLLAEEKSRNAAGSEEETAREYIAYGLSGEPREVRETRLSSAAAGVVETVQRSGMEHDAFGRLVFSIDVKREVGEGVDRRSETERRTRYDAAGRAVRIVESGRQNGRSFSRETENLRFDREGRPETYRERGNAGAGGYEVERFAVEYDEAGRVLEFREIAVAGGQKTERVRRVEAWDAHGREVAVVEEGRDVDGEFFRRTELAYSRNGGVSTERERGRNAASGEYEVSRSGISYDAAGRRLGYVQVKKTGDTETTSRWTSLGEDGYQEAGDVRERGELSSRYTRRWEVLEKDALGRVAASRDVFRRELSTGRSEESVREQTDLSYDSSGRVVSFVERNETVSRGEGGASRRVSLKTRLNTEYQESGPEAWTGRVSGFSEVEWSSEEPEKSRRTYVSNVRYDPQGRQFSYDRSVSVAGLAEGGLFVLSSAPEEAEGRRLSRLFAGAGDAVEKMVDWVRERDAFLSVELAAWLEDGTGSFSRTQALGRLLKEQAGAAQEVRRLQTAYDSYGRPVRWRESAPAASGLSVVSDVSAAYEGATDRLSRQEIRTQESGAARTQVKDKFIYDRNGTLAGYRQTSLDEGGLTVDGNEIVWERLADAAKGRLLDDIFEGRAEVWPPVTFELTEVAAGPDGRSSYAAGKRYVRGTFLAAISEAEFPASSAAAWSSADSSRLVADRESVENAGRAAVQAAEDFLEKAEVLLEEAGDSAAEAEVERIAADDRLLRAQAEEEDARRRLALADRALAEMKGREIGRIYRQRLIDGAGNPEDHYDSFRMTETGDIVREAVREYRAWALSFDAAGNAKHRLETRKQVRPGRVVLSGEAAPREAAARLRALGGAGADLRAHAARLTERADAAENLAAAEGAAGLRRVERDEAVRRAKEAQEAREAARSAAVSARARLLAAQEEAANGSASARDVMARRHAESAARIVEFRRPLVERLSRREIRLEGRSVRLSAPEAEGLLSGEAVEIGGFLWDSTAFLKAARLKESVAAERSFFRSEKGGEGEVSLEWQGTLSCRGVPCGSSGLAEQFKGRRFDPEAIGFAGEGTATLMRTRSEARDSRGRLAARTVEVHEISSAGGVTARQTRLEETVHKAYDAAGRPTESERRVTDGFGTAFQKITTERILDAVYDGAGRLVSSRTRVAEAAAGFRREYEVLLRQESFDSSGRPERSTRTVFEGESVSIETQSAPARHDGAGRLVFKRSELLRTTRAAWQAAPDSPAGERSIVTIVNLDFDAAGRPAVSARLTEGEEGRRSLEIVREVFDPSGRPRFSRVETLDSLPGQTPNHHWSEVETFAYLGSGLAARQRRTEGGAGGTVVQEDLEDRAYDLEGRLVTRRYARRSSFDGNSEVVWRALRYDDSGRLLRHEQVTRGASGFRRETSIGDAAYERDFVVRQETQTEFFDASGALVSSVEKREEFLRDRYGRVVTSRVRAQERLGGDPGLLTDAATSYEYDDFGRVRRTSVRQSDSLGSDTETVETVNEILAFDERGFGRRVRNTTRHGDRVTERTSLEDVAYDSAGRAVRSRDALRETGGGAGRLWEESFRAAVYDDRGRLTAFERETTEGALRALERVSQTAYDALGRQNFFSAEYEEFSPGATRRWSVTSGGMKYDAWGNLTAYDRVVRRAGGESRERVLRMKFAGRRLEESLVETEGPSGRGFEWTFDAKYDAAGRLVSVRRGSGTGSPGEWDAFKRLCRAGGGERPGGGPESLTISALSEIRYDRHGRTSSSVGKETALAWDAGGRLLHRKAQTVRLLNLAFDGAGRVLERLSIVEDGAGTTRSRSRIAYDERGRISSTRTCVEAEGTNGDGSRFAKSFFQEQTVSHDGEDRVVEESVRVWGDTAAPAREIRTRIFDVRYNPAGRRTAWNATTSSGDSPGRISRESVADAAYDAAGRMTFCRREVVEEISGGTDASYRESVRNEYDQEGRLIVVRAERSWGVSEGGPPGGGIAGLDPGWTAGDVLLTTAYSYAGPGSSPVSVSVTAAGSGRHGDEAVEARGIRFTQTQSDMRYDESGRVVSYRQSVTQVERYEYQRAVRRGIRKKVRGGTRVEEVSTESHVRVLASDSMGRQTHTLAVSTRNDLNRTAARTETWVKEFDSAGRAKEVFRTNETKTHLGGKTSYYAGYAARESLAYGAGGEVDRDRTRTVVTDKWQKSTDRSLFTKSLQAADIVVAVACAVLAPVAPYAAAMVRSAWQGARQGVSVNDFEAHPDRAQARQSRLWGVSSAVSVGATALPAGMSAPARGWIQAAGAAGAAAAAGADAETFLQVAAVAAVGAALGGGTPAGDAAPDWRAGAAEALRRTGIQYGDPKQRASWRVLGAGLEAAGRGAARTAAALAKAGGWELFSSANAGAGASERTRFRRGLVLDNISQTADHFIAKLFAVRPADASPAGKREAAVSREAERERPIPEAEAELDRLTGSARELMRGIREERRATRANQDRLEETQRRKRAYAAERTRDLDAFVESESAAFRSLARGEWKAGARRLLIEGKSPVEKGRDLLKAVAAGALMKALVTRLEREEKNLASDRAAITSAERRFQAAEEALLSLERRSSSSSAAAYADYAAVLVNVLQGRIELVAHRLRRTAGELEGSLWSLKLSGGERAAVGGRFRELLSGPHGLKIVKAGLDQLLARADWTDPGAWNAVALVEKTVAGAEERSAGLSRTQALVETLAEVLESTAFLGAGFADWSDGAWVKWSRGGDDLERAATAAKRALLGPDFGREWVRGHMEELREVLHADESLAKGVKLGVELVALAAGGFIARGFKAAGAVQAWERSAALWARSASKALDNLAEMSDGVRLLSNAGLYGASGGGLNVLFRTISAAVGGERRATGVDLIGRPVYRTTRLLSAQAAAAAFAEGFVGGVGFVKFSPLAEGTSVVLSGKIRLAAFRLGEKLGAEPGRAGLGLRVVQSAEEMALGMALEAGGAAGALAAFRLVGADEVQARSASRLAGAVFGGAGMKLSGRYPGKDKLVLERALKGNVAPAESVEIWNADLLRDLGALRRANPDALRKLNVSIDETLLTSIQAKDSVQTFFVRQDTPESFRRKQTFAEGLRKADVKLAARRASEESRAREKESRAAEAGGELERVNGLLAERNVENESSVKGGWHGILALVGGKDASAGGAGGWFDRFTGRSGARRGDPGDLRQQRAGIEETGGATSSMGTDLRSMGSTGQKSRANAGAGGRVASEFGQAEGALLREGEAGGRAREEGSRAREEGSRAREESERRLKSVEGTEREIFVLKSRRSELQEEVRRNREGSARHQEGIRSLEELRRQVSSRRERLDAELAGHRQPEAGDVVLGLSKRAEPVKRLAPVDEVFSRAAGALMGKSAFTPASSDGPAMLTAVVGRGGSPVYYGGKGFDFDADYVLVAERSARPGRRNEITLYSLMTDETLALSQLADAGQPLNDAYRGVGFSGPAAEDQAYAALHLHALANGRPAPAREWFNAQLRRAEPLVPVELQAFVADRALDGLRAGFRGAVRSWFLEEVSFKK